MEQNPKAKSIEFLEKKIGKKLYKLVGSFIGSDKEELTIEEKLVN